MTILRFTSVPNNSPSGEASKADRVAIRDERGLLSDAMTYDGGAPSGFSVERRDITQAARESWNWGVSALEGGTPLAANSVFAGSPGEARLVLSSRRWRRGDLGAPRLTVSYRLAWERSYVRLRVLDPRGRERRLLHDGPSASRAALEWDGEGSDGKPLPPGAYIVVLEARPAEGAGRLRVMETVVLFR